MANPTVLLIHTNIGYRYIRITTEPELCIEESRSYIDLSNSVEDAKYCMFFATPLQKPQHVEALIKSAKAQGSSIQDIINKYPEWYV